MSKIEPVFLIVLLAVTLSALAVRNTLGRYLSHSMAFLDCRRGYYELMSFASFSRPLTTEENGEWIAFNVADGHYLFSKPSVPAHPMVVRRKLEESGERINVLTEGCAFGSKEAYKTAMAKLPPALKFIPEGQQRMQLKAVLEQ